MKSRTLALRRHLPSHGLLFKHLMTRKRTLFLYSHQRFNGLARDWYYALLPSKSRQQGYIYVISPKLMFNLRLPWTVTFISIHHGNLRISLTSQRELYLGLLNRYMEYQRQETTGLKHIIPTILTPLEWLNQYMTLAFYIATNHLESRDYKQITRSSLETLTLPKKNKFN